MFVCLFVKLVGFNKDFTLLWLWDLLYPYGHKFRCSMENLLQMSLSKAHKEEFILSFRSPLREGSPQRDLSGTHPTFLCVCQAEIIFPGIFYDSNLPLGCVYIIMGMWF